MKVSERERLINEAKFGFSAEKAVNLAYSRKPTPLRGIFTSGAFQVSAVLSEAWMAATNDRRTKLEVLNDVLNLPIAKTIVKQMAYDACYPDPKGDSIKIVAQDKDKGTEQAYQAEIDKLCKKYNFNSLVQQLVRPLIVLGEQAVRLSVERGKGLTGIHTDVDMMSLIALYEQGVPKRYLTFQQNEYYMCPGASYAHFVCGSNTIRVKLEDRLVPGYTLAAKANAIDTTSRQSDTLPIPDWAKEELPDFIQMGEPLFEGFVAKIRELQLLESLVVATKLNQITQSNVLGIPIDGAVNPDEATDICREWEERLNSPTSIDFSKSQIGVADVIGTTGILKCVPIIGNGKVESLAVRTNIPIDDLIKAINDVRKMITSNIGIPYSLIYGPENEAQVSNGGSRAAEIRMHGRYVRTLAAIQLALRNGLAQIILTHFQNLGGRFENFNKDSFDIEFINSLKDASELEGLEILDAKNEIAMNIIDGVLKLYSNPVTALMLNPQAVMDKLAEDLAIIAPGHQLIKKQAPIELYKKDFLLNLQIPYDNGHVLANFNGDGNGNGKSPGNPMIAMKSEQFASEDDERKAIEQLQLNEAQELLIAAIEDPILFMELRSKLKND